ncbi:GNAT family N-acetyltransferase [Humibacillus xanthopallidus]|nr:GNAT family N-acetyltransferase [Humibacillus xanthopallidus]
MPAVTVRPLETRRIAEAVDLVCARLPELPRAEAAMPFESPELFPLLVRHTAHDEDDHLVGVGLLQRPGFAPPDRCGLRLVVARDVEGSGVGSALRASLLPLVPGTIARLGTGVFDDDERSLAVARHWGFEIEKHGIESSLDLTELAPSSPLPPGVTLDEVPDLGFADRDAVEHMLRASQTNPEAALGFVMSLEAFSTMLTADEEPVCVVARVDGVPAGITFGGVQSGALSIAYSGVDPAYRGRGIMRAVKERAHVVAARLGARVSNTTNEEANVGIRRINADLGYVVRSGVYRMVQEHRQA